MVDVWKLYEASAADFVRDRAHFVGEDRYLAEIAGRLTAGAQVLDLGCGGGVPIARFFIERGFAVTGVDAAPTMVAICRRRFPTASFVQADMRCLALDRRFDAIVAWDSLFHLSPVDQRAMFPALRDHAAVGGFLLFTSGPLAGEAISDHYGCDLITRASPRRSTDDFSSTTALRLSDTIPRAPIAAGTPCGWHGRAVRTDDERYAGGAQGAFSKERRRSTK